MKRLPKENANLETAVAASQYKIQNFKTGRVSTERKYYSSLELAQAAKEIALGQKTKFAIQILTFKDCPDSQEDQEKIYWQDGGRWDRVSGQYLYSARY
jgi:hypothetical protein